MNTAMTPLRYTIVTFLLITGLTACSTSQKQPAVYTPPVEAPTVEAPKAEPRPIQVNANHPRRYTVRKGDTLWDISAMFLKDPWYWPEIWHKNQQIKNPHLIYPGDILTLIYVNGQPRMSLEPSRMRGATGGGGYVKLGPTIRRNDLDASIKTIPGDAIRQFITRPRVVTKEELDSAPYILASDEEHLILGQGNRIYIRGELDKERVRFTVFRPGKKLINPEDGELLGYEAIYAGEAHVTEYGDPASGTLTSTEREVLLGDRLLPIDKSKVDNLYFPRVPDRQVNGQIISLFDALFGVAKHQIAVINRGNRDGLEVGHILETQTAGKTIRDAYDPVHKNSNVALPNERSGLLMIFSTFERVSYGLVMESTNVIKQNDVVTSPR